MTSPTQRALTREVRQLLAAYRDAKDLIEIGAYAPGANPVVDRAVRLRGAMERFLCQDVTETVPADHSWQELAAVLAADGEPATNVA